MQQLISFASAVPTLAERVFVAPTARIVGDVQIGEASSVWSGTILRGDVGWIRIGKRTNIQDMSTVHVTGGTANTTIGDDVTVGHRAIVHGCWVGDGCLIGMGAIIMDNAVVGEGSVVGAGAVVTPNMQIPPGSLVLGLPAKVIRPVNSQEAVLGKVGATNYVELAARYLAEQARANELR